jgi:hypothetical protein
MTIGPKGSSLPQYTYVNLVESTPFLGVSDLSYFTVGTAVALASKKAFGIIPAGTAPYNLTPAQAVAPTDITHRGQDANSSSLSAGGNLILSPGVGTGGNASGNVVVKDTSGNSSWIGSHLVLGVYHLWIDALGRLRVKNSAPTSDTDGTVVGAQS